MKKKESYYCAWCKREMHKAIVEGFHGICLECFKKYFPKEFSELTDKQRKKIGIAKNPES